MPVTLTALGRASASIALAAALVGGAGQLGATATPTPADTTPVIPSAAEVAAAKAAAAAGAAEVDKITTASDLAQAQLTALEQSLSQAQAASDDAEALLAQRQAATDKARSDVADAQTKLAHATQDLANQASLAYQQGGSTSGLSFMLATSDVASLMDLEQAQESINARQGDAVVEVSASAQRLTAQQRLLGQVEMEQAQAAAQAKAAQGAAQAAATAGADKAAQLTTQLNGLQQQLNTLTAQANSLATQRTAGLAAQARARAIAEAARKAAAAAAARQAAARGSGSVGASIGRGAASAQAYAASQMGNYGWGSGQFGCLVSLWNGESGWSWSATNPSSGAYGIPQSLPSYKMASAGSDWLTNPATQIRWGMGYIRDAYGSPCNAWSTWQARSPHWY